MPSTSKAQQRLMGAAEHGADFPMARKLRASMTHQQLHDFAAGSMKRKPEHVKKAKPRRQKQDENHQSHMYDWRQRANLKRGR